MEGPLILPHQKPPRPHKREDTVAVGYGVHGASEFLLVLVFIERIVVGGVVKAHDLAVVLARGGGPQPLIVHLHTPASSGELARDVASAERVADLDPGVACRVALLLLHQTK